MKVEARIDSNCLKLAPAQRPRGERSQFAASSGSAKAM